MASYMSGASDGSAPAGGTEPPIQPILSVSDALPHKYIPKITFNCKSVVADQALQQATDLVDRGERNWKRTNVTILHRTKHRFQPSCSKCLKKFSAANPGNFWGMHSKQCTPDGAPCGQVFQSRTQELGVSYCCCQSQNFVDCLSFRCFSIQTSLLLSVG
jgi:hypothetical protein